MARLSHPREQGSSKRLSTIVVLMLAIAALVVDAGRIHYLLVPHVRCAEHGDWHHAEDQQHSGVAHSDHRAAQKPAPRLTAQGSLAAQGKGEAAVVQPASTRDAHDHEQCPAFGPLRATPRVLRATLPVTVWSEELGGDDICYVYQGGPRPVYSYAPKTSPPDSGHV